MEKKNGLYFRKANAKATIVPSYSVETYFAVSEEQAKRKRIKRCIYPELPDQQGVSVCVPGAYVTGIDTDGDGKADTVVTQN